MESLDKQWYFSEINIDKVNCFGVALYVTGYNEEVEYVHIPDWLPKLKPGNREYGSLAIFGENLLAAVCLGDTYFCKWGIGQELGYAAEEELTNRYGDPEFYQNNF